MQPERIEDLRRRAEAGEPRAQYALAAALAAAGRRDEADHWLNRAAAGGEAEAHYTLATRKLQSSAGVAEARALLEKSVSGGSPSAARALAVLMASGIDSPADWPAALALVAEAAECGDAAAARDVAGLLLLADIDDEDGARLLAGAAENDAVAGAAFVRRAAEGRADADKAAAVLGRLSAINYPRVQTLHGKLAGAPRPGTGVAAVGGADFALVAEKLARMAPALEALGKGAGRPSRQIAQEDLGGSPRAFAVRAVAPPEISEYLIAAAARCLAPSMTFDPVTGVARQDEYRTSLTATMGLADQDLTLVAVNHLLADVAGLDHAQGEFLSVLRYAPGQEYRPHFDWIPPAGRDFAACGQRIRTALLYLNDEYDGGETHFLSSGLSFKGAPGDVLVFSNVTDDGAPDQSSRHAGLPVRGGVKWVASKWFRERRFSF